MEENFAPKHPFELFGIECGKGWRRLILPLFEYIEQYNEGKDDEHSIRVLQVKEKWGGLCFYTNFVTKELSKMIEAAEEDSYNVCEDCGSRENVGLKVSGWNQTLCRKCVGKYAEQSGYPLVWEPVGKDGALWVFSENSEEPYEGEIGK